MTTTVTSWFDTANANGVAPIPFQFQAISEEEVGVLRAGIEQAGTFTVALNGDGTGSVTPLATWGADEVFIYSKPSYQQPADFERFGAFYPDQIVPPLDRLARSVIALSGAVSATLRAPVGQTIGELPTDRAGLLLSFDADGDPILISGTGADAALRADLAAAAGSALVGYTGAGGPQRSTKAKLADFLSVKDFGAKGDSNATASIGTDDTAAIATAIAYLSTQGGGALYFPEGFYKVSSYFTLPKNVRIVGASRDTAIIVATHAGGGGGSADLDVRNGSVFYSNWPSNNSTKVAIAIEHLGITCVNAANVGAGFYDNGGSFVAVRDCHILNFKYPVIFDQTEVSAIEGNNLDTSIVNGACIWLVNGALLKAGNAIQFTNRISIRDNQLNGGAVSVDLVRDDGGYTHSFTDNNYNGGQYQLRFAGALSFSIRGGEFEGASKNPISFNNLASDGVTAMGTSFGSMHGGIVTPGNAAGGFGSVQITGVGCTVSFYGVNFSDSTTVPINGSNDGHYSVKGCSSNRTDGKFLNSMAGEIYLENAPLIVKPLDAVRNANFDDLNGISRAVSASVLTIPADATFVAAVGAYMVIEQATATAGAGFAAGAGCTVTGPLLTNGQGQWILAHKVAANTWVTRLILQKPQAAAQAHSVAVDVAGVVADLNALIDKLKATGQMGP